MQLATEALGCEQVRAHDASTCNAHPLCLVSALDPDPTIEMLFLGSKKKPWPGSLPLSQPSPRTSTLLEQTTFSGGGPCQAAQCPCGPHGCPSSLLKHNQVECRVATNIVPRGSPSSLSRLRKCP